MARHIFGFSLALLLVATCHGPTATTAAPAATPSASQEYLDAHNAARGEVGVGPLKWSEALANATSLLVRYQRDKMGCKFADLSSSKYGGNQLWSGGLTETPREAVEYWVKEKQFYNHTDNTCAPDHQCGVYTQVVWRKTAELGCSQAKCPQNQTSITVCFYNPPGNIVGESPY